MSNDVYRIQINGEWSLEDLYSFPHTYSQVYAFLYNLEMPLDEFQEEKIGITFTAHPWLGGYSAVNFYNYLKAIVPITDRPKVISIRYGSPGLFELGLVVSIALSIEILIKKFVSSAGGLHSLYNDIYRGLQERKLMRIEVKRKELVLERERIQFIDYATQELSRAMGFKNVEQMNRLTGNPLATLKILLSFYRRIRTLAEYDRDGKAIFK